MKTSDYDCEIEGKHIAFYHNQTTHRYEVVIEFDALNPHVVTKAKGLAIIRFLKALKLAPRDGSYPLSSSVGTAVSSSAPRTSTHL
jgi:hypothetical protein